MQQSQKENLKIDKIVVNREADSLFDRYRKDWVFFAEDVFGVSLDTEQQKILRAVQHNKMVAVCSGTARGKDFVTAVAAMCFMYLTPTFNGDMSVKDNTKVALTAPTARQVENIMMPEIARLYSRAERRGKKLIGRLTASSIRTDNKEWFLVGFKADSNNHEAWSGFHASNVMFAVTEATGISEDTFAAIEGNLQGNSRLLCVFNPNTTTGYAANAMKQERWQKFRLSDLNAPNVLAKRIIHSGQVDYEWVRDKVNTWCKPIAEHERKESENDFEFEGVWYRPNDLFRIKVMGEFPKAGADVLIPPKWIELAQERWKEYAISHHNDMIIGCDVAGMGRDCSVECHRQGNYVLKFAKHNSGGEADHMAVAGTLVNYLNTHTNCAVSIDTIGEGAGVYSRCIEIATQGANFSEGQVISCKNSNAARNAEGEELTDITGEYKFANMRAYLGWCLRDWLNPDNQTGAMLPPNGSFYEEATNVRWQFQSNGSIILEPKERVKERIGHSPDEFDALANTFHPDAVRQVSTTMREEISDEELEEIFF